MKKVALILLLISTLFLSISDFNISKISENIKTENIVIMNSSLMNNSLINSSIKINNELSYPAQGHTWFIKFLTKGNGTLKISGQNTTFNHDVKIVGLFCGLKEHILFKKYFLYNSTSYYNNSYYIYNWSCNSSAFLVLKEITKGKHKIIFDFKGHIASAENDAAGGIQETDLLLVPQTLFPFNTDHFNDSTTEKEIQVLGDTSKTFYINIPKTSFIKDGHITISGEISAERQTLTNSIYSISAGNMTSFDGTEVVVAADGFLGVYENSSNWTLAESLSSSYIFSNVIAGNFDNNPGDEVAYTVQEKLFVVNGSNLSKQLWNASLASDIVAIAKANIDSDSAPEIAVITYSNLYLFDNDGTLLWSKIGVGVSLKAVAGGDTNTSNSYDEILIGSTGTENLTIFNATGTLLLTKHYEDIYSISTGNLTSDYDGDEIVLGLAQSAEIISPNGSYILKEISLGAFDRVDKIEIGDLLQSNDGNEIALGITGSGSSAGHLIVYNYSGTVLWDYDTQSGAITGLFIGDILNYNTDDVLISNDDKEWFVQNGNFYPQKVYFTVGNDLVFYENVSMFSGSSTINITNSTRDFLNSCSENICKLPLEVNATNIGTIYLNNLIIWYNYNLTNNIEFTSENSLYFTDNIVANNSYPYEHTKISFNDEIFEDLTFNYIEISSGSTNCFFSGNYYLNSTQNNSGTEVNTCDLTSNPYHINANGTIPEDQYLWDDTKKTIFAAFYNSTIENNTKDWNGTFRLYSNYSLNLTNVEMILNISNTGHFNNETLFVILDGIKKNITPLNLNEDTCNSDNPTYSIFDYNNYTFYTCADDTDENGVVDLFKIKQNVITPFNQSTFFLHRYANYFPYVTNVKLSSYNSPWNRTIQFNITIDDNESDPINVSLYVMPPNSTSYLYEGWKQISAGDNASFNVYVDQNWIGLTYYYFNYTDYYHEWQQTATYSDLTVRKHYVNFSQPVNNGSNINRSNGMITLGIRVYDKDDEKFVGQDVLGRFHISGFSYALTSTNSSGFLLNQFDPNSAFDPGPHLWYFSVEDSNYVYNESNNYTLYVWGDINIIPSTPTLEPPEGSDLSRKPNYRYPNVINWSIGSVVDDYGFDLNGTINLTVLWRNITMTNCSNCTNFTGNLTLPEDTPLFQNNDFVTFWINRTWYNPYHFVSSDYVVHDAINFTFLNPSNDTIVYRTSSLGNDSFNFSVHLELDGQNLSDANVSIVTTTGECKPVINYTGGIYNCTFNPEDNASVGNFTWWVEVIYAPENTERSPQNRTFLVYAITNLSSMQPANNSKINYGLNNITCLVTDYDLNDSYSEHYISNKTVYFYNGSELIGTSKTNKSGIASVVWNTSNLTRDTYYNITCNVSSEKFFKVIGDYQEIKHNILVDYFEQLFIQNILANKSPVLRTYFVNSDNLNDTINLTVWVYDEFGTNVTGANVHFYIFDNDGNETNNLCTGVEIGNGKYYCPYNPPDQIIQGIYNWTAWANATSKKPSENSSNTTILIKAISSIEFLNKSLSFNRQNNSLLVARLYDENNNSLKNSTFECMWFFNGIYNTSTLVNSSGYCKYLWLTNETCYFNLPAGVYNVSVKINKSTDENYYVNKEEDWGNVTLSDSYFNLEILKPTTNDSLMKTNTSLLNISVTDSCGYNIENFTANWSYYSYSNLSYNQITYLENQTDYYWTLSRLEHVGKTDIIVNVSVDGIGWQKTNVSARIKGWAEIYDARTNDSSYVEGDIIEFICNISDANLTKSEFGFNISAYNVGFYVNGTYKFSNTSKDGLVYFYWNTFDEITEDSNYNLTCILNESSSNYNRSYIITEQQSSTIVYIDSLAPMLITAVSPPNLTKVARYDDEHYYNSTANLTVYVSSNSVPVTDAVITWIIPNGSCIQEINYSNGYYSCIYDPNNTLEPGIYNWSAYADAYAKERAYSGNKSLTIMGMVSVNVSHTIFYRTEKGKIISNLIDLSGKARNFSNYNCSFYFNGTYIGWNLTNSTGICIHNLSISNPCSYPLKNYTINVSLSGFSNYWNSSYYNSSNNATLKDKNISLIILNPESGKYYIRNFALELNSTANDTCGPVITHELKWYQDGLYVAYGDNTLFDIVNEPLGWHNITSSLTGPFYEQTNNSVSYQIWAYSKVTMTQPSVDNVSHNSYVDVICFVNESDTNNPIYNYSVNFTEDFNFIATNQTNISGGTKFIWHPLKIGLIRIGCDIGDQNPYTPSTAQAFRIVKVVDDTPPFIYNANISPETGFIYYFNFSLNATVGDLVNVSSVWFVINNSFNSTNVTLNKKYNINATTAYYEANFTPQFSGAFDVYALANDTSGNIQSTYVGLINILSTTYGNLTIYPDNIYQLQDLTRTNTSLIQEHASLENIGSAPMFESKYVISIPKGFILNATTKIENSIVNETDNVSKTLPQDFFTNNIIYTNYTVFCNKLDSQKTCILDINLTALANATPGNNSVIIYFIWKNPDNSVVQLNNKINISIKNNTKVVLDKDEIVALVSPGYKESLGNITIQAFGNTHLYNATFKIIPPTYPPTLMNDDWFNFSPSKNFTNLTKLSDTLVNITMFMPVSNYTYEYLNYHYPAESWSYDAILRITLNDSNNTCRISQNCYYEIPLKITVGAAKWAILDYDIVQAMAIDEKIAYNQTSLLGFIKLHNFQTQSTGEISYNIIKTENTSDYLKFNKYSDSISPNSDKIIPLYYETNESTGNYTGKIIFDATSDAIKPNLLNITVNLEIVPFAAKLVYPTEFNSTTKIKAGDLIDIKAKITYNSSDVNSELSFKFNISGKLAQIYSQEFKDGFWYFKIFAPNLTKNPIKNYLRFSAYYNEVEGFDFENNSLIYLDVTPPWFENQTISFSKPGDNATLGVNIYDNVRVDEAYVNITFDHFDENYTYINTTNYVFNLTNISDFYFVNLTNLSRGDYFVQFIAYDNYTIDENGIYNLSNRHKGTFDWQFGVYNKTTLKGTIRDQNNIGKKGKINLLMPETTNRYLFNISTDDSGYYIKTIHQRYYALNLDMRQSMSFVLNLDKIDFVNLSNTYDFMLTGWKSDINGFTIDERKVYKVLGFKSKINSEGTLYVDYSDTVIDDLNKLYYYVCDNWNFYNESCDGTWTKIDSKSIVSIDGKNYLKSEVNFNGHCAFALVNDQPPIDMSKYINIDESKNIIDPNELRSLLEKKLNESREELLNKTRSVVDPYLEGLTSFEDFHTKYGLNIENIQKALYPGENLTVSLFVRNPSSEEKEINIIPSESIKDLVNINYKTTLKPYEHQSIPFIFRITKSQTPGIYSGYIKLTIDQNTILIPVDLRILVPAQNDLQIDLKPVKDSVVIGKDLAIDLNIYNPLNEKRNVTLSFEIYDKNNKLVLTKNMSIELNSFYNNVVLFKIPKNLSTGEYFVKTKVLYDIGGYERETSRIKRFKVVDPVVLKTVVGIPVWIILATILSGLVVIGSIKVQKYFVEKSRRYHLPIEFKQMPLTQSPSRIYLGKLSEVGKDIYYDIDNLMTHTIIAGSTGGGKTVAAQGIIESALENKIGVVVFDPTAQWTGFFRKNTDSNMFKFYAKFGYHKKDARAYPGTIVIVEDMLQKIDLEKYLTPGEITVFSLHKLNPKDIDIFVASTVKQVFNLGLDESSHLKNLLVYDEVHRLLPKFGGSGAGFIQIERACREFRKWGFGLILISQVLSDFIGEIKANINTEIQMRTKDEGDLERLKTKYGEEVMKSVVKAETGNGMIVNPNYNKGKPFMINFKPLKHSPHKLKETELEKYNKYNLLLEEIIYNVNLLERKGIDVFDLKLELKLAKEKLSSGSFNLVDMYFEGLNERLEEVLKNNGMKRQKIEMKKINLEELEEEIERAKALRQ